MPDSAPSFNGQISIGNILTMLFVLFAAFGAVLRKYITNEENSKRMIEFQEMLDKLLDDRTQTKILLATRDETIANLKDRIKGLEDRIEGIYRRLENRQGG
jgi:predicted  nucleic acid-binding Zn-ribbon protein